VPRFIVDVLDMKRKLFLLSALCSMLMCVGVAWWWTARSASKIDQLTFQSGAGETVKLWGSNGKLMLTRTLRSDPGATGVKQVSWGSTPCDASGKASPGGSSKMEFSMFAYGAEPIPEKAGGGTETTIIVPAWMLVAVFSVLPLTWAASKMKGSGRKKPSGA
jgi:hypothetical protein